MLLRKQQLNYLPHQELAQLSQPDLASWVQEHKLHNHQQWLLPQLVAHVGTYKPSLVDGVLDFGGLGSTSLDVMCMKLAMLPRSKLILNQTKAPHYSQLVPLLLLAWRQAWGIPYSHWQNHPRLPWILEPKLLEATQLSGTQRELVLGLGRDQILEYRQLGLQDRSGKPKQPQSTWKLNNLGIAGWSELPPLTQTIVAQCWLAHPQLRSPNMILDPINWDNQPQPLVAGEVFLQATPPSTSNLPPWLL